MNPAARFGVMALLLAGIGTLLGMPGSFAARAQVFQQQVFQEQIFQEQVLKEQVLKERVLVPKQMLAQNLILAQNPEPPPPPPSAGPVAPPPPQPPASNQFSPNEVIDAGHHFFGGVSRGLAALVERAGNQWGQPNGYILGEEAGGAFIGGLRYGDGTLYTKNAGDVRVYWQGPSLGFDAGADGARTMMLVYNLPRTEAIFERFGGVAGSAYFVGGLGMTALTANDIVVVPIRSGVGLRLGANLGYLKFTSHPTWNPF